MYHFEKVKQVKQDAAAQPQLTENTQAQQATLFDQPQAKPKPNSDGYYDEPPF
jgi:hypothetical protein